MSVTETLDPKSKNVEGSKNAPMQPLAWLHPYESSAGKKGTTFCTTMGAAADLRCADLRRLLVNAAHWCMEESIEADLCVDTVGAFDPRYFGFAVHEQGRRPADYA